MEILAFETKEHRDQLLELCKDVQKEPDVLGVDFALVMARTLPEILKALGAAENRHGGELGEQLREALSKHFLARIDGRALLKSNVRVVDLTVSYFGAATPNAGKARAIVHLEIDPC